MKTIFPSNFATYVGPPIVIDDSKSELRYGRTGDAHQIGNCVTFRPDGFKGPLNTRLCLPRCDVYIKPDDFTRHCPNEYAPVTLVKPPTP